METRKVRLEDVREILVEKRIFLLTGGGSTLSDIGRGYPEWISYPSNLSVEPYTSFFSGSGSNLVSMGAFSYTNGNALSPLLNFGRYCSIAGGLKLMGAGHPVEWVSTNPVFYQRGLATKTYLQDVSSQAQPFHYREERNPVRVGNDVWIGWNVTLKPGITIGNGAVIASNAVVTKDVAPYSVVGGIPAKHLRYRFSLETIVDLTRAAWWDYEPAVLHRLPVDNPTAFVDSISKGALGDFEKYNPEPLTAATLDEFAD